MVDGHVDVLIVCLIKIEPRDYLKKKEKRKEKIELVIVCCEIRKRYRVNTCEV